MSATPRTELAAARQALTLAAKRFRSNTVEWEDAAEDCERAAPAAAKEGKT